jgi:hypothetical protein
LKRRLGRRATLRQRVAFGLLAYGLAGCANSVDATPAPLRPEVRLDEAERVAPATCAGAWTAAATGRVVDTKGRGIAGASVNFCVLANGNGTCLQPVTTQLGGWYTYPVPAPFRCMEKLTTRVLVDPARGLRLTESYCKEGLSPVRGVLDLTRDHVLDELAAPLESGPITTGSPVRRWRFAEDLEVTFDPEDVVEGADSARLSAGRVNVARRPCFVPASLALDALFAFAPNMNVLVFADRPNIAFALPNVKHYPDGTEVDLYLLGGLATQLDKVVPVAEGAFVAFGVGVVRGGRVVPKPGSELPALTYVGYAKRPSR